MLGTHTKLFFAVSLFAVVISVILATWGFPKIVKKQIQKVSCKKFEFSCLFGGKKLKQGTVIQEAGLKTWFKKNCILVTVVTYTLTCPFFKFFRYCVTLLTLIYFLTLIYLSLID